MPRNGPLKKFIESSCVPVFAHIVLIDLLAKASLGGLLGY